jgi:hypothetical protein
MAVLLVATFPILLLIHSPVALLCLTVGILLLYRDNREQPLVSVPIPKGPRARQARRPPRLR